MPYIKLMEKVTPHVLINGDIYMTKEQLTQAIGKEAAERVTYRTAIPVLEVEPHGFWEVKQVLENYQITQKSTVEDLRGVLMRCLRCDIKVTYETIGVLSLLVHYMNEGDSRYIELEWAQ